ncbi:MAG: oligogalacturonate lyase family protein [Tepidisphaeraceae bacterium]
MATHLTRADDSALPTAATQPADLPPQSWVDPDTGHRIWRLSNEPNSGPIYFNCNAFTPDGRDMIYLAPDGVRLLNLATRTSRIVAPPGVRAIQVGRASRTLYIGTTDKVPGDAPAGLYAVDLDTGARRRICDLPNRGRIDTINADETLGVGYAIVGDQGLDYGEQAVKPKGLAGPMVQPLNKGKMMQDRLNAHLPMILFTVDLKTGKQNVILHSTDWLNHVLCSPTDPSLIMYCHEGPWTQVDRIWTIRTDGSQNQLIHQRTMASEIAGHEFWGQDGKTLWYDLQRPVGEDFFLAAYDLQSGTRRWYHLTRDEWSIHFNVNTDASLICGDGGDHGQVAHATDGQWIELFRPELLKNKGINRPEFIQPGVLRSERLVNMAKHNYKSEPNVRFTPDSKMVIYQSNAFGPSYLFGVEVEKAKEQ